MGSIPTRLTFLFCELIDTEGGTEVRMLPANSRRRLYLLEEQDLWKLVSANLNLSPDARFLLNKAQSGKGLSVIETPVLNRILLEEIFPKSIKLPKFRGSTEQQFTAWLRKILENKLLDQQKRFGRAKRDAKREQALAETWRESSTRFGNRFDKIAVDQTSPSQRVAHHEKARLLAEALGALPEDQRTALELHHIEDQSLTETARLMNRTAASVAGLLRRGLKAMRDNLKDRESELR